MRDVSTDRAALLREPNFRWMMGGGLISALGDQFTMIALPWLVLTLTGSALTMGLVIALMSIPRALLILVGGALVDRYSPKSVLMLSKFANGLLLFILGAMVLTESVSMPAVYGLAFGLGLASAFSIPAGTSMLPYVVAPHQLPLANGLSMGMRQLTMLAGPLLAAGVFALFGDGSNPGGPGSGSAQGIGIAFALDSFSFLFSAWTLSRVRLLHAPPKAAPEPMFKSIGAGLAMVWRDRALRVCMLYWGFGAMVAGGTMQVALPVLASTRLGGAAQLGLIMAVHGVGSLAGMALSGMFGKIRFGTFGATLLVFDALIGLLLVGMAGVQAIWQAGALMLVLGVLGGFLQVAVFSWIQQRVPRPMLGRAMSIFMFVFMGLAPLAAAATGYLLQYCSLTQLFIGAGGTLFVGAALAWLFTSLRHVTDAQAAG